MTPTSTNRSAAASPYSASSRCLDRPKRKHPRHPSREWALWTALSLVVAHDRRSKPHVPWFPQRVSTPIPRMAWRFSSCSTPDAKKNILHDAVEVPQNLLFTRLIPPSADPSIPSTPRRVTRIVCFETQSLLSSTSTLSSSLPSWSSVLSIRTNTYLATRHRQHEIPHHCCYSLCSRSHGSEQ